MPTLDALSAAPWSDLKSKAFAEAAQTYVDQVVSKFNSLRAALALVGGDEILHPAGLGVGSTDTHVKHGAFDFVIQGACYSVAAEAAGVDPSALTATAEGKFNGWRLEVGVNGTVDYKEVTGVEDAGYDSAADAAAAINALAVTEDHAILGWVVIGQEGQVVTPGTTTLVSETNALFYDATPLYAKIYAALPAVMV